jgi:SAM-dependent methyltransferase
VLNGGCDLGQVFADDVVAASYTHRPPYPDSVFTTLARRLVAPRTVLDAGAGTGALARKLTPFAERVDALEPSRAMIAEGRRSPGGSDPRIRWLEGRAEDAPLAPPYGLIVCGESLHWMDLAVVLPRFRAALAPSARLAIVGNTFVHGLYREEVWAVNDRFAAVATHRETPDAIADVAASGIFRIEGEERTEPMPFGQSVDDYIEFLHSTSVLTRAQLGDRAAAFDAEMRAVCARHQIDCLRYGVVGSVTWATPVDPGAR